MPLELQLRLALARGVRHDTLMPLATLQWPSAVASFGLPAVVVMLANKGQITSASLRARLGQMPV